MFSSRLSFTQPGRSAESGSAHAGEIELGRELEQVLGVKSNLGLVA
jgi:hypothetical protein